MIDEQNDQMEAEETRCPAAEIKKTYSELPFETVGDVKAHIFGEGDTPAKHGFNDLHLGATQTICTQFGIVGAGIEEVYRVIGSVMLFAAWLGATHKVEQ